MGVGKGIQGGTRAGTPTPLRGVAGVIGRANGHWNKCIGKSDRSFVLKQCTQLQPPPPLLSPARTLHEVHQAGQCCACPDATAPEMCPLGQQAGLGGGGARVGAWLGGASKAGSTLRDWAMLRTLSMHTCRI